MPERRKTLIILAIFILAICFVTVMRLCLAGRAGITRDNLWHYKDVMNAIADGRFITSGPPMTQMDGPGVPGGLYYNLLQVPFRISSHPRAAYYFTVLYNMSGILLLFFMFRKENLIPTALACFSLALCPHHVRHATTYWNANFVFPFIVLSISGLYFWLIRKNGWGLIAAVLGVAWAGQIHFSVLLLQGPALLFVLWVSRKSINRRYAILAGSLAALVYAPYLFHEMSAAFGNTKAMLSSASLKAASWTDGLKYLPTAMSFLINDPWYKLGGWSNILPFYISRGPAGVIALFFNGLIFVMVVYLALMTLNTVLRKNISLWKLFVSGNAAEVFQASPPLFFGVLYLATLLSGIFPFGFLRIYPKAHYLLGLLPLFFLFVFSGWPLLTIQARKWIGIGLLANMVFLLYWNFPMFFGNHEKVSIETLMTAAKKTRHYVGNDSIQPVNPDRWAKVFVTALPQYYFKKPFRIEAGGTYALYFESDDYKLNKAYIRELCRKDRAGRLFEFEKYAIFLYKRKQSAARSPFPVKDIFNKPKQ